MINQRHPIGQKLKLPVKNDGQRLGIWHRIAFHGALLPATQTSNRPGYESDESSLAFRPIKLSTAAQICAIHFIAHSWRSRLTALASASLRGTSYCGLAARRDRLYLTVSCRAHDHPWRRALLAIRSSPAARRLCAAYCVTVGRAIASRASSARAPAAQTAC
jgi:hypothetical protein